MRLSELERTEFERVSALMDSAMELSRDERARWLADLVAHEPRLSEYVAELLEFAGMHPSQPDELCAELREDDQLDAALVAAIDAARTELMRPGQCFGPYRILHLLGRGGMGSVWLAEHTAGVSTRQVALKLLRNHALDPGARERFARERNILAALQHPLIARLLDAGITADGQPYLALEYVAGRTLTQHCDDNGCSLSTRLELMLQVLAAVQYAHRNLVLHRDLKPANILVSHEGQVRLLDFGIAKLMVDGEACETELSQVAGRALTREYASPEQLRGQPLTTASDVYSLGVVLYTLLCGQRPHQLTRDSAASTQQPVSSAEVIRPSQQVFGEAVAAARGLTSLRLRKALVGDLDTIVLKALKQDPAERYATADEMMQDLQRHMKGEPVRARPDTFTYRCGKFIVRNRWQVGGATLLATLLVLTTVFAFWQGQRATTYAWIAQRSLVVLAEGVAHHEDRQGVATALANVERSLDQVGEQASDTRAHLWLSQAMIQREFSLDEMRRNAERALRMFLGPPPPWPCFEVANEALGDAYYLSGQYELAEAADRQALAEVARHAPGSEAEITPRLQLAEALHARLQLTEAELQLRNALASSRQKLGANSHSALQTQAKLGSFLAETGRSYEGLELLEDAMATSQSERTALALERADALYVYGRVAEAEHASREAVELRRAQQLDTLQLSRALLSHARALTSLGQYDASAAELAEASELRNTWGGRSARAVTENPYILEHARLALARGDLSAAEHWLQTVVPEHASAPLHLDETRSQLLLVQVRMRQGRWSEALALATLAADHVASSALVERFPQLMAEAALRAGQASRFSTEGCSDVARAVALLSSHHAAASPWLAEAKAALMECRSSPGVNTKPR